ncbi:MAG: amidohydrolase [Oscillospiraceae bacterium]|nr:amidohydrolase [Oscillospiraceae bacterium]
MTREFQAQEIIRLIEEKRDEYIKASDAIWSTPELYFREDKSAKVLIDFLKKEGFKVDEGVAGVRTAFVGEWGEGEPIIGFLGEFDALPILSNEAGCAEHKEVVPGGPGHGCGHNLLGVGALAAAIAMRDFVRDNGYKCTIRYYGCPAEEDGWGKMFMARAGHFDDLAMAITWHGGAAPTISGTSSLAVISCLMTFKGKTSHAASAPHLGRSALDAAELTNVGVNYLREHIIPEARVHYAYQDVGGTAPNVVQDRAVLKYFIRAPKVVQAKEIAERVKKCAIGASIMTDTEVDVQFISGMCEVVQNDVAGELATEALYAIGKPVFDEEDYAIAKKFYESATEAEINGFLGRLTTYDDPQKYKNEYLITDLAPYKRIEGRLGGSTDVGDVSYATPTVQIGAPTYAVGTPGHSWKITAQAACGIGHKGMLYAAKVMALTGIIALDKPEKLKEAYDEYVKLTGGKYICPVGPEVKAQYQD